VESQGLERIRVMPEIEAALASRSYGRVRVLLESAPPRDVADLIEAFPEGDRVVLLRLLPREQASDVFEYLDPDLQEGLIRGLGQERVSDLLNDMSPDDRTALLEELPASITRQLMQLLTPEERQIAQKLLGYPEESVGRLMTPDYVALEQEWTVQEALDHIREHGDDSETLNLVYITDARGRMIDDLRIRQLLVAPLNAKLREVSDGHFVSLRADDDQETAVLAFGDHDRVAMPVLDSTGVLLGIVTVDDVFDVAEEEVTEDIHKLGGMEALDEPYMRAPFGEMLKKRSPWLIGLFLAQMITINAMRNFEGQLQAAIALVAFIPLIISSGGNSGTQAATLVVRAMALGEVQLGDWWRVVRREVLFGLTLGAVLSLLGFLRIAVGAGLGEAYDGVWGRYAIAIGGSLICVVMWGVLIGSMLPFLLRRLGFDPAASSTPFVATLVDVTGLIIYLSVASMVL